MHIAIGKRLVCISHPLTITVVMRVDTVGGHRLGFHAGVAQLGNTEMRSYNDQHTSELFPLVCRAFQSTSFLQRSHCGG